MNRLRNRLLLVFLAATLAPLAATLWITASLLDRSLSLAATNEVDQLTTSLQETGRALFATTREAMQLAAETQSPRIFRPPTSNWPQEVRQFYEAGEKDFQLSGEKQDQISIPGSPGFRCARVYPSDCRPGHACFAG